MKILYITTSCTTEDGVSANRVLDLSQYFIDQGHQLTLLTSKPAFEIAGVENLVITPQVKQVSENYLQRWLRILFTIKENPKYSAWVEQLQAHLLKNPELVRQHDVALINTHPFCLAELAENLKSISAIPVVIDMQDPYGFNPYSLHPPLLDRKKIDHEKLVLQNADALTVITPSMKDIYQLHYSNLNVVHVSTAIPSYLPKPLEDKSSFNKINIWYGGSLHGHRVVFPLLEALKNLNNNNFQVDIYGNTSQLTKFRYRNYSKINWHQSMPRMKFLKKFNQECDVGLVVQSFKGRDNGVSAIAAKTYEYLALNKPIIYLGPAGDNQHIIERYSNNYYAYTKNKDLKDLISYLDQFSYKENNTKKEFYKNFTPDKVYQPMLNLFEEL